MVDTHPGHLTDASAFSSINAGRSGVAAAPGLPGLPGPAAGKTPVSGRARDRRSDDTARARSGDRASGFVDVEMLPVGKVLLAALAITAGTWFADRLSRAARAVRAADHRDVSRWEGEGGTCA